MHHIAVLQFWSKNWQNMGVEILEVHSVFSFWQTAFLKEYVEGMAAQRAAVKGKDDVLAEGLKLTMNALFGKMSQNKRKQKKSLVYHLEMVGQVKK